MATLQTTCNGTNGHNYNLYLEYSVDSPQDVPNNRSYIRLSMWAQAKPGTSGAWNNYDNVNFYSIAINGSNVVYASRRMDFRNNAVVTLGTYEGWVNHNSDGSLSITIGGGFNLDGVPSLTGGSISGSWTLPTIPRASHITSFPNFNVDGSSAIVIDRKSTSFTHILHLYLGSTFIGERTGIGASTSLTLTATEQDLVYSLLPTSVSATVTLYCRTFNGGTAIGDWTGAQATISVPSTIVPSFTAVTATETATYSVNGTQTNLNTIVGKFVQLLSKIKFSITGATASKGTSAAQLTYKITVDGTPYNLSSVTIGSINKGGNITVTGLITDTRGRTAAKSITVNLLAYGMPEITQFDVSRCNSDSTANAMGTYTKVVSSARVSSLLNSTERNSLTYKIYSKLRGTTDWGTPKKTGIPATLSTASLTDVLGNGSTIVYTATASYDLRIDVSDKFNTTISLTVLSTGEVMASWARNGLGIGKIWERGALDVKGDEFIDGSLFVTGRISSEEWNPIVSLGNWSRIGRTNASGATTLSHSFILSLAHTRNNVVVNASFLISSNHSYHRVLYKLHSGYYTQISVRLTDIDSDNCYIEVLDNGPGTVGTGVVYTAKITPLDTTRVTSYTSYTAGGGTERIRVDTVGGGIEVGDKLIDHNFHTDGANGFYIRYASGFQICIASLTFLSAGAGYNEQNIWWFPAGFLWPPVYLNANLISSQYGSDQIHLRLTRNTEWNARIGMLFNQNTANVTVGLMAMGRWK